MENGGDTHGVFGNGTGLLLLGGHILSSTVARGYLEGLTVDRAEWVD